MNPRLQVHVRLMATRFRSFLSIARAIEQRAFALQPPLDRGEVQLKSSGVVGWQGDGVSVERWGT